MSRTTSHRSLRFAIDWWHDLEVVLEHAQKYTRSKHRIGTFSPPVKDQWYISDILSGGVEMGSAKKVREKGKRMEKYNTSEKKHKKSVEYLRPGPKRATARRTLSLVKVDSPLFSTEDQDQTQRSEGKIRVTYKERALPGDLGSDINNYSSGLESHVQANSQTLESTVLPEKPATIEAVLNYSHPQSSISYLVFIGQLDRRNYSLPDLLRNNSGEILASETDSVEYKRITFGKVKRNSLDYDYIVVGYKPNLTLLEMDSESGPKAKLALAKEIGTFYQKKIVDLQLPDPTLPPTYRDIIKVFKLTPKVE